MVINILSQSQSTHIPAKKSPSFRLLKDRCTIFSQMNVFVLALSFSSSSSSSNLCLKLPVELLNRSLYLWKLAVFYLRNQNICYAFSVFGLFLFWGISSLFSWKFVLMVSRTKSGKVTIDQSSKTSINPVINGSVLAALEQLY